MSEGSLTEVLAAPEPFSKETHNRSVAGRSPSSPRAVTYSISCSNSMHPIKCESMGAAIATACKFVSSGVTVWQINGSDGFKMERKDIEIECTRRRAKVIR